jgi:hypothetical protein
LQALLYSALHDRGVSPVDRGGRYKIGNYEITIGTFRKAIQLERK